jgi:hypothetical protein
MKTWQFFMLLAAIVSLGTTSSHELFCSIFFWASVWMMVFPPKSELDNDITPPAKPPAPPARPH